jgi:haloacetate dehalogenase
MTDLADLFPGYQSHWIDTSAGKIFARTGGKGPALLLLHGYAQTNVMWHLVAPALAEHFSLVIPDLPGYGWSAVPESGDGHAPYDKRSMANAMVELMEQLGQVRFRLAGHDRGGRVAYRLALDHPEAVSALLAIDVIPTGEVWRRLTAESAVISYHWGFLAQPAPVPERLIGGDPDFYLEHTLKSWSKPGDLSPFSAEALEHYRALLREPARLHAICEDYRAGATIDRRLDDADVKAARKISCPTFLAWGSDYLGKRGLKPLQIWRSWCNDLSGAEIPSGHFLAEENPGATLAALLPFIAAQGAVR